MSAAAETWARACLAAALFARDPAGLGGVRLRARPGPVREAWLARLRALLPAGRPVTRLPAGIADDALLGGLDLAATLRAGRPVVEPGLLARSHGGVVVVPMAERLDAGIAARLARVLETGAVDLARDGVAARLPAACGLVLLDEGDGEDEAVPSALLERAAFHLDLDGLTLRDVSEPAPPDSAPVSGETAAAPVEARAAERLCALAAQLGIASLRAPIQALRAARQNAGREGRSALAEPDLAAAAALVLAPRATRWPAEAEAEPPPPEAPPEEAEGASDPGGGEAAEDRLLAAVAAALPAGLLARLTDAGAPGAAPGRAGGEARQARSGRPVGARPGDPRRGPLALSETLRAAAPWQRLRRGAEAERLRLAPEDIRVRRFVHRAGTTTIFAVDASGSAALERLAEAKGAVELLLAECYVRRDRVALVAFRGRGAELLLPPTRALVRAKRALAALPGGGGTPLAAGIEAAALLAAAERRGGRIPVVLLLTDGRANIGRGGAPGRAQAAADALAAGRALAAGGTRALVIDTAAQPQDGARRLAEAMAARYLPMPRADAALLSEAVRREAPPRGAAPRGTAPRG
ncbi:von Willebrand factor type A [Methylobacterium sp. 4-46]|uniref:magnesium chelatase subunit D n=1 Tax=unclassified Methylobacterium TaxID=2615210 RepID=UPI000165C859|nr:MULTISPECIES: magnesium chelatase subunit D [Methylobacterium]ACA18112.1 von Willebrand factor type A [Methylobacterium sp. 4-46]WFT77410.1 magnesium chelatase subunit D [Methylobacterium nodulans]